MNWLKHLGRLIISFFSRRLVWIGRIVVGLFMIGLGLWFTFAPITQQFLMQTEALQQSPYLWLIVPVGLLQISIGYSLLRPLWHKKHQP
ncbi:MAG: hypothetical protein AAF846_08705 [Chloroflexota bacterium]